MIRLLRPFSLSEADEDRDRFSHFKHEWCAALIEAAKSIAVLLILSVLHLELSLYAW